MTETTNTPLSSARSSLTIADIRASGSWGPKLEPSKIDEAPAPVGSESDEVERRIEAYGGDDVRDPPTIEHKVPPMEETDVVQWDGPNDPTNPQNWSNAYKWFVTAICVIMTINVTFASSAPTTATALMMRHFHISQEISSLVTTTFLLGYVLGPLLWGPGSEVVGRRPITIGTLSAYTLFHLGQALAPNIETLLVTRFLAGFFAVGPLTICGGIIADIWSAAGRGLATSLFSASVFLGPVLGPLVGGFVVSSSLQWYWIFWIMMIFAGTCTIFAIIFLPETYAPIILLKKAQRLRKEDPISNKNTKAEHEDADWSFKGLVHRTIYRPFQMLAMEPILVLITVYLSIVYGVLYGTFQSVPLIFTKTHGFTISQNGLIFIGIGIGSTLGAIVNYLLSRHYPALIEKWRGFPPPEERLYGAMIGAPVLVLAGFWLGWTGMYESVPWYVPAIGTIFLGLGISTIFMSFLAYLVDTYLMYSASAFAANTIIRSLVGAVFPLFTVQMYDGLGINWATTLLALVGLVFVPSPFLFYKYGTKIRARSKFAPCMDLKIAKELEQEGKSEEEKV